MTEIETRQDRITGALSPAPVILALVLPGSVTRKSVKLQVFSFLVWGPYLALYLQMAPFPPIPAVSVSTVARFFRYLSLVTPQLLENDQ